MPAPATRNWTLLRALGFSTILLITFVAIQTIVFMGFLSSRIAMDGPDSATHHASQIEFDGQVLATATFATAILCIPLILSLTRKRERDPYAFLKLGPVDLKRSAKWLLAMMIGIAAIDGLTLALGRPIVPDFMIQAKATANPIFWLAALTMAAPLFEELFFCGFLIGALEASGVSSLSAAIASSLGWAAIHLQYDLFGLATIFAMGLLLALARHRTGSIRPCLAMHAVANGIAFAEAYTLT